MRAVGDGLLPAWLLEPSEWDEARAATRYEALHEGGEGGEGDYGERASAPDDYPG